MDRLVYIAMSGAKMAMTAQEVNSNNLANSSTIGYKEDELYFKSLYLNGETFADRSYSIAEGNGLNLQQGTLNSTGRPLDIAMDGNAWLSVTAQDGTQGYVHSASLRVNENGALVTHQGFEVNSKEGFAVTVPANGEVSIDKQGGVNIREGQDVSVITTLKIDTLPEKHMYKGANGLLLVSDDGLGMVKPAGSAVLSGTLEQSNVSPVNSLVSMISLARQYETYINAMSTAVADDKASNELLTVR